MTALLGRVFLEVFSFTALNRLCPSLLACKVAAEKSDGLMEFLVCNKLLFLGACKIFFSSLTLTFYVSW